MLCQSELRRSGFVMNDVLLNTTSQNLLRERKKKKEIKFLSWGTKGVMYNIKINNKFQQEQT